MTKTNNFPVGWDEERVQNLIRHYETQTDEEATSEDEAAFEEDGQTVMVIPIGLVPAVRGLLAQYESSLDSSPRSE
jgi:hypothetical protein